jgi:hypothetical protein
VVHVVVSVTLVAVSVPTMLPAVPAAAGAPAPAAIAPPTMRLAEICAKSAAASAGVSTGLSMKDFMELEILSIAEATDDGTARHAGMYPIVTLRLPGPGLSGLPCEVESLVRAAGGIRALRGRYSQA